MATKKTPAKPAKAAPMPPAEKAAEPAESRAEAAAVAPPPLDAAGDVPAVIADAPTPPEPPVAAAELPYRVISPLRHDGKRYAVRTQVMLSIPQAERLIGMGVVALHDEPAEG